MQSAKFRRKKLLAYILTVCILAIIFNLPKFYEVELEWENNKSLMKNGTDQGISGNSSKSSEAARPTIKISGMRKDPNYSKYYIHFCRLIVLGVIPFVLIAYYNGIIYKHICQGPKLFEEDISKRMRQKQE